MALKWQPDSSDLLKCRFPLLDEGPNLLSPDSKDERETLLSASCGSCNCIAQVQLSVVKVGNLGTSLPPPHSPVLLFELGQQFELIWAEVLRVRSWGAGGC